jgi:nicotinate-nucleotide pyrophosphorylase (carboxylating)
MPAPELQKRAYLPIIRRALKEDLGKGDVTSQLTVPEGACGLALIMAKQEGVLAGIEICRETLLATDAGLKVEPQAKDGDRIEFGQVVLTVQGRTRSILAAERTALNFLQHLSGIATITSKYVEAVRGTRAKILDTRKTTPGMRALEKYAVACGGGQNHRMGLWDMVLIKDNHIEAAGGVASAIRKVKEADHGRVRIEVEVQNLAQLEEAVAEEPDVVMLDNMKPERMAEACRLAFSHPARDRGKLRLEASGNVSLDNVREIAQCGVDFISVGAVTHSAPAFDFSLKLKAVG